MGALRIGERVRVSNAEPPGHVRTPHFVRGHTGTIVREFGRFRNPERLAYGMSGLPELTLYQVLFSMQEIWQGEGAYEVGDTLTVDLYEHWLEPCDTDHDADN
jgi:nitrile hydratase